MKSLILLGKGPSVSKLSHDFIDSHEKISWCNIHNDKLNNIIPARVNYLYLRRIQFITDLPVETQTYLNNKNIEKIYTTGWKFKNVLNKSVDQRLVTKKIYKFNASTGLLALYHTCTEFKPKNITIAGFDLFEKQSQLYYHSINEALTSRSNLKNLKDLLSGNILTKGTSIHSPSNTIVEMDKLIKENKDCIFTIVSNNIELNNKLSKNENVKLW